MPIETDATHVGETQSAPLTRALVLQTALDIIDRDGVAGLSMRRLGDALNRDPMSLYRYASNKAALLDGVAELVLEQLTVDTTDDDWESQLRTVARTYRDLALTHPKVVPLLVTRPLATPLALRPVGTLRPLEHVLELLTRAGFSTVDALHIYRSLIGLLQGHVLNELQELVDNPDETDDLLRLGLHRLPLKEFPLLRSLAPDLANYDGEAELERSLDILLTGLRATYPHHTTTPPVPTARPTPRRDPMTTEPDSDATWTASEWLGKTLIDRDGERIGKLQDVYVDVETDEPRFATVKEGFLDRHLTFVPLAGVEVGPDELRVTVARDQVRSAPDLDLHGQELSQADESALYHHFLMNYTPIGTHSGRRLARR